MTDHPIRPFTDCAAVRRLGTGLLDRTLPRAEWTHEAHLAACLRLVVERPDIALESELPEIIRGCNVSVGGVNDATQGYHETLTQLYIRAVRSFATGAPGGSLVERVNALLANDIGDRAWPLRFYSRDLLFSRAARLFWAEPDLAAIIL